MLLRNWLVSAEKPCWYPHDDVTVRKPISLSFLQQQADKKAFHAGSHLFWFVEVSCFSTVFPNLEECKWNLNNFFSHCIFLTTCLYLHESAHFMTFKVPIPQNSRTHSSNLLATANKLSECVWPFSKSIA